MDEEKPAAGETVRRDPVDTPREDSWQKTKGKKFYFESFVVRTELVSDNVFSVLS